MRLKFYFIIIGIWIAFVGQSQELNFQVSVVTQGSLNAFKNDAVFFNTLETKIKELINVSKWTEDEYQPYERIKGNFQLTVVQEISNTQFRCELVWQSERPVFNSIYTTTLISLIDKNVIFEYTDLQPLFITNTTFYDNLSSIISFYVYMTLGFDYDSFKLNGGELYFQKAMEIINSLDFRYRDEAGWILTGGGRRNRYWFVENILNPRMRQFRQAYYDYHRQCLDKMYDDPAKSRALMLSAITSIGQADIEYPSTYLIQIFGDAKKDEIIEIFKNGDKGQKTKVKTIMVGMDATKAEKYNTLF